MTQEQLAVNVGLSRTFVTRLELGQYDPPLSTLVRLSKALRVSVTDLLGESMSGNVWWRVGDLRVIHQKAPSSRPRSGSRAMRLAGDLPV
ncbi:MAG: helix-turn-helix transcriptional regulator [Nitrospirae bacterium]|nr:helix-turn-helix transcriptional regulator [Nitrospirota bacterium]